MAVGARRETTVQHDHFIGQVQARARLASRGEAESATRATLETLGERIPEGLAERLAGQLPREIAEHLRRTEVLGGSGSGERFDRHEFIDRVANRAGNGVDPPRAAYLARVVFEVVDDATEGRVIQHVTDSLPDDLSQLLTAGSTGHV
ncbi:MAG TPA: DUF2267 domain-containing protein [Actinopolymorphaceae bacterium]